MGHTHPLGRENVDPVGAAKGALLVVMKGGNDLYLGLKRLTGEGNNLSSCVIFVVMAAQFESPKFSFMVMTTIPFSLVGSFGLLKLTGVSMSMTSILGFLILVGTVVNNGILYVDTVNQYRMEMPLRKALIEAGATRMRPIMMTSLTTILSMLPMAMAFGSSGSTTQGLAVVNIGGLSVGVLVALFILPVYYALMNGRKELKVLDI